MKMFLAIYYFCYYRWCRQNSHDLNTAYTCGRCQQKSSNSSIFIYPVAELFSYAHDLTSKLMHLRLQSEDTVDRVSLYLTSLAFGAPTGGNAPCSNFAFLLYIATSVSYVCVTNPLQEEKMGMYKVRIVSLSPKRVCKQDGIVEVREETDCSGITSVNKKTSLHGILEVPEETDCRGITVPVAIKIEKSRKEDLDERDIC
ncbi:hypothetical protein Tsp_02590 [Trichinella spiralis]|uniref:hypothetical protein n=1 Tax=Trichinella spiralis TaxID=6334 RepID=UPI0001EFB7E5|nr:hypothetical protein Tsp_02590 [Trichinella spiralis]